jgi:hypothetical protein
MADFLSVRGGHWSGRRHNWGGTGGTPDGKDGEIWVRMGKFYFQPWVGRGATTGVFGRRYVENKGLELAPREVHRSEHANGEFQKSAFLRGVKLRQ